MNSCWKGYNTIYENTIQGIELWLLWTLPIDAGGDDVRPSEPYRARQGHPTSAMCCVGVRLSRENSDFTKNRKTECSLASLDRSTGREPQGAPPSTRMMNPAVSHWRRRRGRGVAATISSGSPLCRSEARGMSVRKRSGTIASMCASGAVLAGQEYRAGYSGGA